MLALCRTINSVVVDAMQDGCLCFCMRPVMPAFARHNIKICSVRGEQHFGLCAGRDSCATGTCSGSTQAKAAQSQRPQQSVTAQSCCARQPCGQWDALWALENFAADAKILGHDMQTLNSDAQRLSMDAFGRELEAVSVSGSEQISDYEPMRQRNRSSLSSEESDSRSSLGSTRDWQV